MRLCLLVISETTSIKSHQSDSLNMSWTRTIPIDMPKWVGKNPWSLNPIRKDKQTNKPKQNKTKQKNYRQLRNAESRRHSLSQERAHQLVIHYQIVNPENLHTSNTTQTELVIAMYLGICECYVCLWLYIYMHVCNNN